LEAAIREYIDVHNENPKPFVRTADQSWTVALDNDLVSVVFPVLLQRQRHPAPIVGYD
jgi:hypothetical protein